MPLNHLDRLRFGACWYPDQWNDPDAMTRDLELMNELGLDCVRVFEGAWSLIEPHEGAFTFTFVDRVLDACAEAGLGVILGTPTYAAPAWLEQRYPAVIARREDGSQWYRHSRRLYDYTDLDYRHRCRRVVDELARRYAADPRIWAWQVDNEMWCHCHELWGDRVRAAFQRWLARHYEDVDELNQAWGLVFWSNQVEDFSQVDLPGSTPGQRNHHHHADYLNFLSDLAIEFLHEQVQIIKTHHEPALVLHNAPFDPIDRAALLEGLDAYGHDHYPAFEKDPAERPAMGLDFGRVRAYAKRLWVVEQQTCQCGQTDFRLPAAAPGELGAATVQSIGHGADLICWFRWRAFPAAQETNWGGLLPHWGVPGRHFWEAKALVALFRRHGEDVARTRPLVSVARLLSFRQWQAHVVEPWITESVGGPDSGRRALRELGLNENHLRPDDLARDPGYQVALAPHAVAIGEDETFTLTRWVEAGGVLVVGPLAGHRDENLQGPRRLEPPGPLAPLTGTANGETTTWPRELQLRGIGGGAQVLAGRYGEIIEPRADDTTIVATYLTDWLAGRPAVCERRVGAGRVIHCGVPLDDAILHWLWEELHLPHPDLALLTHENGAEVLTRVCDDYVLHFAINHGAGPAVFQVRRPLADLATGQAVTNSFTLQPSGWRVVREYLT